MKCKKAYAPGKMYANNRPTKTTAPNPNPAKRGKRPVTESLCVRVGAGTPSFKISAEYNKQCRAENKLKREEFCRRADESCEPLKAAYWRQRAAQVTT